MQTHANTKPIQTILEFIVDMQDHRLKSNLDNICGKWICRDY